MGVPGQTTQLNSPGASVSSDSSGGYRFVAAGGLHAHHPHMQDCGRDGANQYNIKQLPAPHTCPLHKCAAGLEHTCAILDTGNARCWGKNDKGQLGNPSPPGSSVPLAVGGNSILFQYISTFYDHVAAIALPN